MSYKFLSVQSCFFSDYSTGVLDITSLILPLFQVSSVCKGDISFKQACAILYSSLKNYVIDSPYFAVEGPQDEGIYLKLKEINLYFDALSKGTLYSDHYQDLIHPLLIQIAYLFRNNVSSQFLQSCILPSLLESIISRECVDEHRYSLSKISSQRLLSCFDPPLRSIVQGLIRRMDSQISHVLRDWDNSVFKGFFDSQYVHYTHIVYMHLDALFGIAGGSLYKDTDIILDRNSLASEICKAVFKDKLTISHLLSEGHSNWLSYFANQLSIGGDSSLSDFSFSLNDLVNSPTFLSFIRLNGLLSSSQLDQLKQMTSPTLDVNESCTLTLPWLYYSDELNNEQTVYNDLFVKLLISHIYLVLDSHRFTNATAFTVSPENEPHVCEKSIQDRLISNYFLSFSPSIRFTYQEIHAEFLLEHDNPSKVHTFLKPFLNLSTLLSAYCEPSDVLELFQKYLFPNRHLSWSFDVLLMMVSSNLEAFLLLPFDQVKLFNRNDIPFFHSLVFQKGLLRELIEDQSTFLDFLKNGFISDPCSPLHLLAAFEPNDIYMLANADQSFFHTLCSINDNNQNSVIHALSYEHPHVLIKLLEDNPSYVHYLKNIHNHIGNTVFHFLVMCSPESLMSLIKNNVIHYSSLCSFQNSKGFTPFTLLFDLYPVSLFRLLRSGHVSLKNINDLKFCKDESSLLYKFITLNPIYFCTLIQLKPSVLDQLSAIDESSLSTLFIDMAKFDGDILSQIINFIPSILPFLLNIFDDSKNSIFHFLAFSQPEYFSSFIRKGIVSVETLSRFQSSSTKYSPLHWLILHHSHVFYNLVSEKLLTFSNLKNINDLDGNSVFHLLAQINPSLFHKLICSNLISLSDIKSLLNSKNESPVDIFNLFSGTK